jgi:hypothetical protein
MTIIEGLVYLMLSMTIGTSIVGTTDSEGDASFCLMCAHVGAKKESVKEVIPVQEVTIPVQEGEP